MAGKKEKENYEEFIQQYTEQLSGIRAALDDTFGEAWDFSLDPIALQVYYHNIRVAILTILREVRLIWLYLYVCGSEEVKGQDAKCPLTFKCLRMCLHVIEHNPFLCFILLLPLPPLLSHHFLV